MNEKLASYTAAGVLPTKVLLHQDVYNSVAIEKRVPLIHAQLNPTTRCQLNCKFCSCRNQDSDMDVPIHIQKDVVDQCVSAGCRAVTITGGGEPTLYPHINELLTHCFSMRIEVGLVSNGFSLNRVAEEIIANCTWSRISVSDELGLKPIPRKNLENIIPQSPEVDWSFSYVVTKDLDYEKIAEVVTFANEFQFTHVRLVSDLLDLDSVPAMDEIRAELSKMVDDNLVIYQGRKEYTRGAKRCWISLLKSLVGPDGKVYPCCGTQYAEDPPAMNYSASMCMGNAEDIGDIIENQVPFDGSRCVRCYYGDYNRLLELLLTEGIEHLNFV